MQEKIKQNKLLLRLAFAVVAVATVDNFIISSIVLAIFFPQIEKYFIITVGMDNQKWFILISM